MKISAVRVRDFKRLREVVIAPDADASIVLIAGENAQGKSSLLDALSAAFSGRELPEDPIRHGAESAEVRVELDGGALVIRRKITASGATLEVRDADGVPVRNPQERLTALVGLSMLDPFEFLQLKDQQQRQRLLSLVPEAVELETLASQHEQAFTSRTNVGRDLRNADGELERLPPVGPAPVPPDVAALQAEWQVISQRKEAAREASTRASSAQQQMWAAADAVKQAAEKVARLQNELQAASDRHQVEVDREASSSRSHATAEEYVVVTARACNGDEARLTAISAQIRDANALQQRAAEAAVARERRAKAAEQRDALKDRHDKLTAALAKIDARRTELLASATMPLEGLGLTANGISYNGVPLEQASGAERLRVALALAIATRPGLQDVWIRDGALLGDASLAAVAEYAQERGVRVWIERVGTRDAGALIIEDGELAAVDEAGPAPAFSLESAPLKKRGRAKKDPTP